MTFLKALEMVNISKNTIQSMTLSRGYFISSLFKSSQIHSSILKSFQFNLSQFKSIHAYLSLFKASGIFQSIQEMSFPRLWKTVFQGSLENRFPKLFTKVPDKQEEEQASKSFLTPRYTTLLAFKNKQLSYQNILSVFGVCIWSRFGRNQTFQLTESEVKFLS